jgi:hypothetical protein
VSASTAKVAHLIREMQITVFTAVSACRYVERFGAVWRFTRSWRYVCVTNLASTAQPFCELRILLPSGMKPIERRPTRVDDGLQRGQRCEKQF